MCAATNRVNLAFKTTKVKDTKLTPAVIPFYVGQNNSLNFFAITNIREKSCRVSVPVSTIIPWLVQGINDFTGTETFAMELE